MISELNSLLYNLSNMSYFKYILVGVLYLPTYLLDIPGIRKEKLSSIMTTWRIDLFTQNSSYYPIWTLPSRVTYIGNPYLSQKEKTKEKLCPDNCIIVIWTSKFYYECKWKKKCQARDNGKCFIYLKTSKYTCNTRAQNQNLQFGSSGTFNSRGRGVVFFLVLPAWINFKSTAHLRKDPLVVIKCCMFDYLGLFVFEA